ncbi:cilia- and flagella-associated protein 300 [Megalops cyprinoides]|uniref:cilia- and flagella-associated protein 300 n=1 Tax=Megalops cyprinoides TaxID=118141 RepID=UPI001864A748|nr:cilia- and flagella-associated protein 300 [Megalops cyprinoides]
MAAGEDTSGHKFSFSLLSGKTFSFIQDKNTSELFMKWSMLGRITAQAFNFDQPFQPYKQHEFAFDFFNDPCVMSNLKMIGGPGSWKPLEREVTKVNVELVPCTKLSMDLFDPLYSHGIVHPSGHIAKCFHEYYADFDELRKMLLIEDSENYEIISLEDREEFLFRLLKHICLGGELCQYEDTVGPYIDTTRLIYKDMVSVNKDPETKEIRVVSTVLKVSAYDHSGLCYPSDREEEQTFAYLVVDPFRRHVYVLYHSYGVGISAAHEECALR